jgi:hypothetical protein
MPILLIVFGLTLIYISFNPRIKKIFFRGFRFNDEDVLLVSDKIFPSIKNKTLCIPVKKACPQILYEREVLCYAAIWFACSKKKNIKKNINIFFDDGMREIFIDDEMYKRLEKIFHDLINVKYANKPLVRNHDVVHRCETCIIFSNCEGKI